MKAFITGSQVYGEPRPDSDVDIVVEMDLETLEFLQKFNESNNPKVLKFGRLNIIPVMDDDEAASWKSGTDILLQKTLRENRRISRDEAKETFDMIRASMGLFHLTKSPSEE